MPFSRTNDRTEGVFTIAPNWLTTLIDIFQI